MNIPVLGIPHYNRPDLLRRCLASIDYPVDKLVVVQNGPHEMMLSQLAGYCPSVVKDVIHIQHPNAGVAGSWNEIAMLFPAPWIILSGNDIQFAPGDLKKLADAAEEKAGDHAFLFGNHGHSLFVWTQTGINRLGIFDFNIFPAYTEDCDMSYRVSLAGMPCYNVQGLNAVHGEAPSWGSSTIHSCASLRAQNGGTHGRNWEYYIRKWGGKSGEEKFKTPYNIPGAPIDYIHFDPEFREKQKWV